MVVVVAVVVVGGDVKVYLRSSFVLHPKFWVRSMPPRSHILACTKVAGGASAPSRGGMGCHCKLRKTSKEPPDPSPSIMGSPWCPLLLAFPLLPFLVSFDATCASGGAVVRSATAVVQTSCASALDMSPRSSLRSASTTAASPGVHLPLRPSTCAMISCGASLCGASLLHNLSIKHLSEVSYA